MNSNLSLILILKKQFLKNNNKDIIEQPNWFKPEKF
jgi:hypothetical protein